MTDKNVGLRKAAATVLFLGGVFVIGGGMVWYQKISDTIFADMVGTAGWVTVAFITGNVIKGGVRAFTNKGGP